MFKHNFIVYFISIDLFISRKMLGSYGAKATGVDPGICWPTDEQVALAGKWEEMYQDKPLIEQIRDAKAGIVKRKEDRIAREKAVDEGLAKMDAQIKQWKARVNSKNMAAEHERLRREKVGSDISIVSVLLLLHLFVGAGGTARGVRL